MQIRQGKKPPRAGQTRRPRRRGAAIGLGALEERLGYFIRRMQIWVFQDFIRGLASIDISPAQYSVLVVIAANPGLSQAELSETLGIERARLVRLLHRLDRRGLTQRLQAVNDGRTHALRLTAEGQKVLARARTLSAQHEARLVKRVGPARYRILLEILRDL